MPALHFCNKLSIFYWYPCAKCALFQYSSRRKNSPEKLRNSELHCKRTNSRKQNWQNKQICRFVALLAASTFDIEPQVNVVLPRKTELSAAYTRDIVWLNCKILLSWTSPYRHKRLVYCWIIFGCLFLLMMDCVAMHENAFFCVQDSDQHVHSTANCIPWFMKYLVPFLEKYLSKAVSVRSLFPVSTKWSVQTTTVEPN